MKQTNDYSTVFIILMAKDIYLAWHYLLRILFSLKKYTHENKNFFNQNGRANAGWVQLIKAIQSCKNKILVSLRLKI